MVRRTSAAPRLGHRRRLPWFGLPFGATLASSVRPPVRAVTSSGVAAARLAAGNRSWRTRSESSISWRRVCCSCTRPWTLSAVSCPGARVCWLMCEVTAGKLLARLKARCHRWKRGCRRHRSRSQRWRKKRPCLTLISSSSTRSPATTRCSSWNCRRNHRKPGAAAAAAVARGRRRRASRRTGRRRRRRSHGRRRQRRALAAGWRQQRRRRRRRRQHSGHFSLVVSGAVEPARSRAGWSASSAGAGALGLLLRLLLFLPPAGGCRNAGARGRCQGCHRVGKKSAAAADACCGDCGSAASATFHQLARGGVPADGPSSCSSFHAVLVRPVVVASSSTVNGVNVFGNTASATSSARATSGLAAPSRGVHHGDGAGGMACGAAVLQPQP